MSENWPKDHKGRPVNPWYGAPDQPQTGGAGGGGMKQGRASLQFPWWFFGAAFGGAELVRLLVA